MGRNFFYIILIISILLVFRLETDAQHSHNGYWLPAGDTLRVLLVFAEAAGDPDEPGTLMGWEPGGMPPDPDYFFDPEILDPGGTRGMLTRYYHQASFGRFVLLGDYYPHLVSIPYDEIKGDGFRQVIDYLDTLPGEDLVTAHGFSLNEGDFDRWSHPGGYGTPKILKPDNLVDMMMILWRVNSRISTNTTAGYCVPAVYRRPLKSADGFMAYSSFVNKGAINYMVIRHEFSHTLLGGNNFHTGGAGAGIKTFMSSAGGYAMLSSWDRSSPVYNGFDRGRLGWKPVSHQYYISCRDPQDLTELDGDLLYGREFTHGSNEFLLRDFVTSGDAIRISLPYLDTYSGQVSRQWLWLENHQMKEGAIDHNAGHKKGIYSYIQVGKESLSGRDAYSGNCNYTWPLAAFGNHDFLVDTDSGSITVSSDLENPFTGYNFLINMAWDFRPRDGLIYRDELFLPREVILKDATLDAFYLEIPREIPSGSPPALTGRRARIRDRQLEEAFFSYKTYPLFGSVFEAFIPGMKMGAGSNPAAVPVLTHRTGSNPRARPGEPAPYDNRHIFLNGLSVEILEQDSAGGIRVRIRWDDYSVDNDRRWCGNIVLREKIVVQEKKTVTLDQGLTPQRPENPVAFDGQTIFAGPTVLTCMDGSRLILERRSGLILQNGSTLILEPGSYMEIGKRARLVIDESSGIIVRPGAELKAEGRVIPRSGLRPASTNP